MADRRASVVSDDAGAMGERRDNNHGGEDAAAAPAAASAPAHVGNGAGVDIGDDGGGGGRGPSAGGADRQQHGLENGPPLHQQHWHHADPSQAGGYDAPTGHGHVQQPQPHPAPYYPHAPSFHPQQKQQPPPPPQQQQQQQQSAAEALATVQYYEAKMRGHAAAYATAAAGAAWAAAQIAASGGPAVGGGPGGAAAAVDGGGGGGGGALVGPAGPGMVDAAADQARAAAFSASTVVAGLPGALPMLPAAYHPQQPLDLNGAPVGYDGSYHMDPMAHGSMPSQEETPGSNNHRVGIYEPVRHHHPPYHHDGMSEEEYAGNYYHGSGPNKRHQPTSHHGGRHHSSRRGPYVHTGTAGPHHHHPEPMPVDPSMYAEPGSGAKKQKRAQGGGGGPGGSSVPDAAGSATAHTHHHRALWYPPSKSRSRRGGGGSGPQTYRQHDNSNNDDDEDGAPVAATDHRRGRRRNRSSVDLAGTGSGNSSCDGARRSGGWKKNKASAASSGVPHHHHYHHQQSGGPKPFNPVGKTGVSALHELCDKRHWGAPRFVEVQLNSTSATGASNEDPARRADQPSFSAAAAASSSPPPAQPLSNPREFVMSVSVDGRELGRGRGGTKASARQDAARHALVALVPGVVFDANGILLHLGGGVLDPKAGAAAQQQQHHHHHQQQQQQRNSTSLEDLAPNLASIAIGNGGTAAAAGTNRDGCLSPAPSEDSSISTAVSTTGSAGGGGGGPVVVMGGPANLLRHQQPRSTNNIYPCASTTSGVSSASEDNGGGGGGDDAYYASRGASVCSALLHAMAQIDPRIRDPPTYCFDVCANPAAAAAVVVPAAVGAGMESSPPKSTKRKGGGGDGGVVVASRKRQSATNAVGTSVTIHRSTFSCTAALVLYAPWSNEADAFLPNDSTEANKGNPRKDDDGKNASKANEKSTASPPASPEGSEGQNCCDEVAQEKLEAVGTGATKREARHVASAKLLALLFPECSGMVEVKEAAEAAREKYAASKALSKQKRTLTSSGANTKRASRRRKNNPKGAHSSTTGCVDNELLASVLPAQGDLSLPKDIAKRIRVSCGFDETSADALAPFISSSKSKSVAVDVSVAALSISDSSEAKASIARSCTMSETDLPQSIVNESSLRQVARQRQLEEEVDAALQLLEECDEERRLSSRDGPIDDVGRTILRRAGPDDSVWVNGLLSRSARKKGSKLKAYNSSLDPACTVSPVLQLGAASSPEASDFKCSEELSSLASLLWGGKSVILVLSRAVAACNEPPLGCAVLTLGFSMMQGRILTVSEIAQEEHLPYERFVECLESFAAIMKCSLDATSRRGLDAAAMNERQPSSLVLQQKDVRKLVCAYSGSQNSQEGREKALSSEEQSNTLHHLRCKAPSPLLQSVKEEEGDEDEEYAPEPSSELEQPQSLRSHKPSKRTRVA